MRHLIKYDTSIPFKVFMLITTLYLLVSINCSNETDEEVVNMTNQEITSTVRWTEWPGVPNSMYDVCAKVLYPDCAALKSLYTPQRIFDSTVVKQRVSSLCNWLDKLPDNASEGEKTLHKTIRNWAGITGEFTRIGLDSSEVTVMNNFKKSLHLFKEIAEKYCNEPKVFTWSWMWIGSTYKDYLKQPREAIKWYEKVVENTLSEKEIKLAALWHIAECYHYHISDLEMSKKIYQTIINDYSETKDDWPYVNIAKENLIRNQKKAKTKPDEPNRK